MSEIAVGDGKEKTKAAPADRGVSWYAGAAGWVGLAAGVGGLILMSLLGVMAWWVDAFRLWCVGAIVLIPLALGAAVWSGLTAQWGHEHATRAWRIENQDRRNRMAEMLAAAEAAASAAAEEVEEDETVGEVVDERVNLGTQLQLDGWTILAQHYQFGEEMTREECESRFRISQRRWNRVNEVLQAIGAKGERGWTEQDAFTSMGRWMGGQFKEDGRVLIRVDENSFKLV